MNIAEIWRELEMASSQRESHGQLRKRLESPSNTNFYLSLEVPSLDRKMIIEFESDEPEVNLDLPTFKSLFIERKLLDNNIVTINFKLQDRILNDVFNVLILDFFKLMRSASADNFSHEINSRIKLWAKLLDESIKPKMSTITRRGLVGELLTILQLEEIGLNIENIIRFWTGPEGAHQDFQFPEFALEVKATTLIKPTSLIINSERELDEVGLAKLFLIVQILDEKRAGTGKTLNDIVESIKSKISLDSQSEFSRKLMALGFYGQDESEFSYELRDTITHLVSEDFPRIVENKLMNGIGNVQYKLQLSALTDFVVKFSEIIAANE